MGRIARKKFILLAVLAAAALAAHSCKVPVIEIKTDNLKLNVPLKTGAFNIAAVLSQALKDTFSSGFAIYDMVNYQQSQAFLAGYQMSLLDSFNPDDMHADIKDQMNQMDNIDPGGIDPIYPEPITIPKMTPNSITGELNWFDMSDLFKNMEDQINDTSVPTTTAPFALPAGASGSTIPLPPNVASLPDFMVFEENNPEKANFDSVVVKEGRIELTLKLTPNGGGLDPGVRIELDGIALKGTSSGSLIGAQTALPVILEYPSFSGSFIVDLASADIVKNDAPKFEIGSITFSYTGIQALAQFNLVIQPQIRDIALQGAKGLRIGEMKPDLPDSIADAVRLDNIPGELLNAEIGGGTLTVRAVLPPYKDPATTYCAGFNMEYRICVRQDPVVFEGQEFPGLSGTGGGSWVIGDSGAVTSLSGRTLSGSGMSVVKKADVADPGIDDYSQIIISTGPDGADFELFDNDEYDEVKNGTGTVSAYKDKSLPVKLDMDMEISRLNVVRWKLQSSGGGSVIPVPVIPEIDFGNTGTSGKDISKYVRSISFEEIKLGLDFTVPDPPPAALPGQDALIPGPGLPEALRDRLALRVTCAGFNLNETKILNAGLNEFASDPVRLVLADAGGTAKKLSIEVSLFPVIGTDPDGGIVGTPDENSGYMELGPLDMDAAGGASLAVYGETGFDYRWTEAEIDLHEALVEANADLSKLSGEYPEKPEDWINLYDKMGKYMSGITFSGGVKAKMFLSGPSGLISTISPELEFAAKYMEMIDPEGGDVSGNWQDGPDIMLFSGPLVVDSGSLPVLAAGEEKDQSVYSGTDLPEPGKGILLDNGFNDIIAALPKDLRFSYEMVLPSIFTVTPDMFDFTDDGSEIEALVVIMLPLELQAAPGAFFSVPDDTLDDGKDLFGRSSADGIHPDKDIFADLNIKSLGIKIDFDQAFFRGALLYLDKDPGVDRDKKLFPDGLSLNNGRNNSLEINLSAGNIETVRNYVIYPQIKIEFPQAAALRIPRDFMPSRITVAASGSYTVDFENTGSGN